VSTTHAVGYQNRFLSGEFEASIATADKRSVTVAIHAHQDVERESPLTLNLLQAVAKGDNADWIIQKSVELGVASIQPMLTERTVVRLSAERAAKRHIHWLGIIAGACEQCGRNRPPILHPTRSLAQLLEGRQPSRDGFILTPNGAQRLGQANLAPTALDLVIGPEGGFSAQEVEMAEAAGLSPLQLGPRILRAETATVAAVTAIQSRWGDLAR
jgi:16S rRNA (uracil1498-N3)-methyltransferase